MFPVSRRTLLAAAAAGCLRAEDAVRRWAAPEANQAVAVDRTHFYAIGNHTIGKYEKATGKRVGGWSCAKGEPLIHLNSGIVRDGVLYCAHSNYPDAPMVSSIEMWDTESLRHTGSHSFGIYAGSATWFDFHSAHRYVTFGHYKEAAQETALIAFDDRWSRAQGWVYPPSLIAKLHGYTISGGTFGPDGRIYCTGHDDPELYVLSFPAGGSVLRLDAVLTTPTPGQGIAWDSFEPWTLYSIDRGRREVVVSKVKKI